MDTLASIGGRLILNEVFEFSDLEAVLKRGDELFAVLPDPDLTMPLSDNSPLGGAA